MCGVRHNGRFLLKPVAFSYLRFSHPTQGKGESIHRQSGLRDAWLQRNGVTLDTSLVLEDRGRAAFKRRHRDDKYALGQFLERIRSGDVRPGSYLIVEHLDRLSREDIVPAVNLWTSILLAGITIVQLEPVEMVFHAKSPMPEVMYAIMELSRGNSESRMKSERVGDAWRKKKERARQGVIMTPKGPSWLRAVDGQWVV